jgi:hypothetical protein
LFWKKVLGAEIQRQHQDCVYKTDHFSRGSIVESTHWMVLHRPAEPAALIVEVESNATCEEFILPDFK